MQQSARLVGLRIAQVDGGTVEHIAAGPVLIDAAAHFGAELFLRYACSVYHILNVQTPAQPDASGSEPASAASE